MKPIVEATSCQPRWTPMGRSSVRFMRRATVLVGLSFPCFGNHGVAELVTPAFSRTSSEVYYTSDGEHWTDVNSIQQQYATIDNLISAAFGDAAYNSVTTHAESSSAIRWSSADRLHVQTGASDEQIKTGFFPPGSGAYAYTESRYEYARPSFATRLNIDFDVEVRAEGGLVGGYDVRSLAGGAWDGTSVSWTPGHYVGTMAIYFPTLQQAAQQGYTGNTWGVGFYSNLQGGIAGFGEGHMAGGANGSFDASIEEAPSIPSGNFPDVPPLRQITLAITTSSNVASVYSDSCVMFDQNVNGVFAGVFSGYGSLVKAGAGKVEMAEGNTYSGSTYVLEGTLSVSGSTSAASSVLIAYGATLGGSGTVGGNTTISGLHSPGNSPGIQTFGRNLSYQQGGEGSPGVLWELTGNSSVNVNPAIFDQIIVGGDLTFLSQTYLELAFDGSGSTVDWTDPFWGQDEQWTLYSVGGVTTGATFLSIQGTNWQDSNGLAFGVARPNGHFALLQSGQNLVLSYYSSPVPEIDPATGGSALSLVAGVLAMIEQRRRRAALVD